MARHECLVQNGKDIEEIAGCTHCKQEGKLESSYHILAECDAFGILRQSIWGHSILEPPFTKLKVFDVTTFMRRSGIEAFNAILEFGEETLETMGLL